MTWLGRTALFLLLGFAGFVGGGLSGAATVPAGAGLEGGATVFLWGLGGMVVAVVCGVVLLKRLSVSGQRILLLAVAVLAALALVWMNGRMR